MLKLICTLVLKLCIKNLEGLLLKLIDCTLVLKLNVGRIISAEIIFLLFSAETFWGKVFNFPEKYLSEKYINFMFFDEISKVIKHTVFRPRFKVFPTSFK